MHLAARQLQSMFLQLIAFIWWQSWILLTSTMNALISKVIICHEYCRSQNHMNYHRSIISSGGCWSCLAHLSSELRVILLWFWKHVFPKAKQKIPLPFEQADKRCVHSSTLDFKQLFKAKVPHLLILKTCCGCLGGAMWASNAKWQGLKKSLLAQAADRDLPAPRLPRHGLSLSMWWYNGTWDGGDIQWQ